MIVIEAKKYSPNAGKLKQNARKLIDERDVIAFLQLMTERSHVMPAASLNVQKSIHDTFEYKHDTYQARRGTLSGKLPSLRQKLPSLREKLPCFAENTSKRSSARKIRAPEVWAY